MSHSNSEARQSLQDYSGTFSACGNQYLGNTFNLSHGDVHFGSQANSDEEAWLRFVRSLRYDRIDERKNTIKENQHRTFEWALEDTLVSYWEKCPLPDWFRSGQGIFLIQGKLGAGKSTLMKFLFKDERTKLLLKQSFNSENVYLLFHSFWCLGQEELQHNWKGLLCSLTSQLAKLHQSSARMISAQYAFKQSVHDWSERELHQLLFKLIERSTTAYCIFIDGLDELNHCDLDKIYDFIDKLTNLTSAKCKVCLASRPMPDIESMNITSTLEIHDYTAKDIRHHVTEVLAACSRFSKKIPPEIWEQKTKSIANSICTKAEGVFLWVEYVLQSVRKGLRISDNLNVIEKRISTLPTEIEQLYRHMLMLHQRDMDANAKEVALIFGMSDYFPISLVQLAVACNASMRNTYVESGWLQRLGKEHLRKVKLDFVSRLNILSAGLVEYNSKAYYRGSVNFTHRTARDFLQSKTELPHLVFTEYRASQKNVLQAHLESYLICLIEKQYPFAHSLFLDLVQPVVQSEFSCLNMLDTLDHVCSSLFQEVNFELKMGLPNWVAFFAAWSFSDYDPHAADLPGLIISCDPSHSFWNQVLERDGVK